MKLISSLIDSLITKPKPTLLGRWRYVGSQKNGVDILEIKLHAYKSNEEKLNTNQAVLRGKIICQI